MPYAGKPLASRQRVFWKVRIWDQDDRPSAWSAPAEWTMGILDPKDWRGQWIASDLEVDALPEGAEGVSRPGPRQWVLRHTVGTRRKIAEMSKDADEAPAVYLRREFDAPKSIRRAVAYVSGLGCFELHVNGRFVGPNLLDPAMCDYSKRVPYVVRDVTEALRQGRNAVGVVLGNGWFNPISPLFHGYYRADFISPPQLQDGPRDRVHGRQPDHHRHRPEMAVHDRRPGPLQLLRGRRDIRRAEGDARLVRAGVRRLGMETRRARHCSSGSDVGPTALSRASA